MTEEESGLPRLGCWVPLSECHRQGPGLRHLRRGQRQHAGECCPEADIDVWLEGLGRQGIEVVDTFDRSEDGDDEERG